VKNVGEIAKEVKENVRGHPREIHSSSYSLRTYDEDREVFFLSEPNILTVTPPHNGIDGPISAPLADYISLWVSVASEDGDTSSHFLSDVGAAVMCEYNKIHVCL